MIVDTHVHITEGFRGQTGSGPTKSLTYGRFQQGKSKVQFLPPLNAGKTAFEPEMLLRFMDLAGVDKAVLLQGTFYGDQNDYVHKAASQWPDRLIASAYLDPRSDNVREDFRKIRDDYGLKILKFEMSELVGLTGLYPDLRLDGEEFAWIWEEADKQELIVTLDLGQPRTRAYQTDAVGEILKRHPSVRIVIAHLGQPPIAQAQDGALNKLWEEQILLGRHPNVWFDTAALPAYCSEADEDYPYPTALGYVRRAAELIGAEKIMWGTDIPGLLMHATYLQLLEMVRRHCNFFSEEQMTKVLGASAELVYGG